MYRYELMNNHYIVHIDGKRFLIDTGWPSSFSFIGDRNVTIDGRSFPLGPASPDVGIDDTKELVGIVPDGFIGMDIISKLGLTIYKNGNLEFRTINISGNEVEMSKNWPLLSPITCGSFKGLFIIDLGAKYGYGIKDLFNGLNPLGVVDDYNPHLKHFSSNLYHLDIQIGSQYRGIDVGYNQYVERFSLNKPIIMVGNITTLFDEVCVIDTLRGRLILR